MLLSPWFAVAGVALAAGPILIHLLNRQRYRVIPWAAMEFLRHAIRRSRRMMRLQDLLLLALRTLCVLLFGLAMARPYLVGTAEATHADQPVHAVLIVDNSLSMGYQQMDTTLLDEAKARAKEFIGELPNASRISVVPLCGSPKEFNRGAYATREDAIEALEAIGLVDRKANAAVAIDLAKEVCRRVKSPPSKQIFLFSDQQSVNWPSALEEQLSALPARLQVVQVAAKEKIENAWIAEFRVEGGIANLGTPTQFTAVIRYEGELPRRNVQVTLAVNGADVASRAVDLEPGQSREVRFPKYQFDETQLHGRIQQEGHAFVPANVSVPKDKLPGDDRRFLMVPVLKAVPALAIDQLGDKESRQLNRYGDSYHFRTLLAPMTTRGKADPQAVRLVDWRHAAIDRVNGELLKDVRLVVIAGVAKPPKDLAVLREFVEQGGSLMLVADGEFDPAAWNDAAWNDGLGILPVPLKPTFLAAQREGSSGFFRPFQLDVASLTGRYFAREQISEEERRAFFGLPFFVRAAEADVSDAAIQAMVASAAQRIEKDRASVGEKEKRLAELSSLEAHGTATAAQREERRELEDRLNRLRLLRRGEAGELLQDESLSAAEEAQRMRPEVLARFTNQAPFIVQRDVGRGRILFVSSGISNKWNTLFSTNTVDIFRTILFDLVERTLPRRNMNTTGQLVLPVPAEQRKGRFTLTTPGGEEQALSVDAVDADHYGVLLSKLSERGVYRVRAFATADTPQAVAGAKLRDDQEIAANGPAEESELRSLGQVDLTERIGSTGWDWVAQGDAIQLAGSNVMGQDLWRLLMLGVLVGLLLELALLAWPLMARERTK